MKDVSLAHGKPLKLEVSVAGVPKPTLRWLRNDGILDENDVHIESKDKYHSLTMAESSVQHAGTYKAVAENAAGMVETTATIEIQTKPLISKPDDIKIVSGSEFLVPITIEGIPEPKIKWMKDKMELSAALGITMDKKEHFHLLHVKESHVKLNGNYSVTATNPVGTDTISFKVTVLGKSMEDDYVRKCLT